MTTALPSSSSRPLIQRARELSRAEVATAVIRGILRPPEMLHICAANVRSAASQKRMSLLRFFMLLSLVVWLGGLIFFAFVVAPAVFSVLPTRHLAGSVVTRTLSTLHWMGLISAVVFAATSMTYSRYMQGTAQPLAVRHLLIYLMIALTLVAQFGIGAKMAALRTQMGEIDLVPASDARRVEFNRLHVWSTRVESVVFLMGLAVLYLTARKLT